MCDLCTAAQSCSVLRCPASRHCAQGRGCLCRSGAWRAGPPGSLLPLPLLALLLLLLVVVVVVVVGLQWTTS